MGNRVTIVDVAKEAGVSIKTVSNVLNNTGSMRPQTRQRVEETIERLGYVLNVSARAMKTGGTKLIGLGIPDLSQPFMPYFADRVIAYAKSLQYGVIVSTYDVEQNGIASLTEESFRLNADGWIIFSAYPLPSDGEVLRQPYPIVLVGDYESHGKTDWVTMPNRQAVRTAIGSLLDTGCRKVILLGAEGVDMSRRQIVDEGTGALRVKGYLEAFAERKIEADWNMLRPVESWDHAGGAHAMAEYLDNGGSLPDAVMGLNDAMTMGAMHEIQRRGGEVPADVKVIGFDNVPESEYCMPTLTTIDPHIDDYTRHAVDMLIERIGGYAGPVRTHTTDFTLIERASTAESVV